MRAIFKHSLTCVSLLALSFPALAQDTAPPADADETEADSNVIIVEARRRDELIQDVPLVINAVTAETIEKLNLRSFTDVTSVVPGLSLVPNGNGIGSSSSMRGVNHDVNVSGENGTIQYYFNDAPVGSNLVLQAMYDIGQIEVLRGPQGTLRGRSTPSGSITVGARRPDLDEVGVTVGGTLASRNTQNAQFGINVPIWADHLAIRVAGLYDKNRVDNVRSLNSTIKPERETQSLRASVRFEPTDWLRFGGLYQTLNVDTTAFDQVQSFSNLVPGFTPGIVENISPLPPTTLLLSGALASTRFNGGNISPGDRLSVATSPRRVSQKFDFYAWNAAVDFAGQSLIYVGSRQDFKFHPITNSDSGAIFPALSVMQDTMTDGPKTYSHEVRLQNVERVAGMFDYVVGYFHTKSEPETFLSTPALVRAYFPLTAPSIPLPPGLTGLVAVTGIFATPTPIFLPRGKNTEESVFGNVTLHLGDATEIAGGLRRIKFLNDSKGLFISCTREAFAAGTCVQAPGTENDFSAKKTIYNATVRHKFGDDLTVYAATGSSFRPPVRAIGDFSASYSPLETAHTALGAESSRSYEIGLKSQFLDRALTFNITAYHQTFKNYPFRAASGVYFVNINAAGQAERSQFNFISAVPVRVNGVESELAWSPSRLLRFSAVANYSDSKIKGGMLACTDVNKDGVPDTAVPTLTQLQTAYGAEHLAECPTTGQSATFLPKWSGTLLGEAGIPIGNSADGYVRGLFAWRGKTKNDPNNLFDDVGSYGLFNAYAGLKAPDGSWDISLFAKNLFNVKKITSVNDSQYSLSVTYANAATSRPFGSASYDSLYSGVSITPPREFGVTARISLGSR